MFGRKKSITGVVICFALCGGILSASAKSTIELDFLAQSFGIELSSMGKKVEQQPLDQTFRETFKTKGDFTPTSVYAYFKSHPEAVLAFREYLQLLHTSGYLNYDETMQLLKSAISGFADNIDFVVLIARGAEITNQSSRTTGVKTSESATEIAIEHEINTSRPPRSLHDKPDLYLFGEELKTKKNKEAEKELEMTIAQLERKQERARLEAQAAYLMQQLAQSNNRKQTLLERVNSILNQHAERVVQQEADTVFDNAEVSIISTEQGPEFNARVLKAFDPNPNDNLFNYGELGLVDIDDRQTFNVGLGIRALDPTERVMYGANVFFDQEFPYDHQRASIGIEMVTSPFRFNANRYYVLSGGKVLPGDITERALSGQDIKTKIAFPYLPYLFLDYTKFKWFGKDGLADVKGQTVGISGALSESLSLEIARKMYDDYASQNSARLTYRYIPGSDKSASIFTPIAVPYTLEKLDAREKYAMTNRENEIQKQQTSPGLQVTFTSL